MFVRPIVSSYFSALSEAIALPLPMLRWVRSGLRWLADPSPECGPQTSFVYCVLKMKRAAPAPLPDLGAPPLRRLCPPLPEFHPLDCQIEIGHKRELFGSSPFYLAFDVGGAASIAAVVHRS